MDIIEKLKGKRILIWGYGREGKASESFIKRQVKGASVDIFEGKREDICEEKYDIIIKSPGIVMPEDAPKYTSQTELFLEQFRDQVIGITGTKGKSTTSSMTAHVLRELSGRKVLLLGNIGEPCLNYFEEIDGDTIIVFEMSCHQLAHVKVSPHIAVFLNLYEEHLDYYGTFEKYFEAKANITRFQGPSDYFYVGDEVPDIKTQAVKTVIFRDSHPEYELGVLGEHNSYNAEFAVRIAMERFGIDMEDIKKALKSFKGLRHRLEFVGEKDGVAYYDDSISTIPEAAISALSAVPNAKTILLGGMDRGIDYSILSDFIKAHDEYNYIFTYEAGKRIFESVGEAENRYVSKDLKEAVKLAGEITEAGFAVILSPAAASYGYFKNFEERGDKFREYAGFKEL